MKFLGLVTPVGQAATLFAASTASLPQWLTITVFVIVGVLAVAGYVKQAQTGIKANEATVARELRDELKAQLELANTRAAKAEATSIQLEKQLADLKHERDQLASYTRGDEVGPGMKKFLEQLASQSIAQSSAGMEAMVPVITSAVQEAVRTAMKETRTSRRPRAPQGGSK